MFQEVFVRFLLSDIVDEFTQLEDELTDDGVMKVLLSKLKFFAKGVGSSENSL